MEEYLSSSEAFAKALKGFHISPEKKIRLAKEAWHRSDVVLPHKQEFLLEWLCSTLVKSSVPSKNPKDTPTNIILDQEYWDLFKDVLSELTYSRKNSRKYVRLDDDLSGSGSQFGAGQALGVLLRVPVIPVFMVLIERLSHHPSAGTSQVTSTKPGKKTKAAAAPAPAHDLIIEAPSITVLEAASTCFGLLSSPLLSEWFQPTLEQYTPLAQTTLEALVDVAQEPSNVISKKQQILMDLAHMVLDRFKRLIVIQPNQKKVFALVAGRMFETIVRARVAIRNVPGASAVECQEALGSILKTGLFHHDHLPEYTAGYIAGDEKSVQSYQKQLFEQIATLIKSEYSTAVLDVLPLLLRFFVEESRRRQRRLANSGFDRGMDSAREIEFSFFKIIYVLAQKQLPQITEEPSEASIEDLTNVMVAHNHLLTTILHLNMYQPSNDETADQFVFMSTSFGSIYSCLRSAEALSNGKLQSTSLTGIVVLAQLDDRLLKPHLDSLWPVLFCPLQGAEGAALDLAKTLLEIYGKASELKIFLNSLFTSLRQYLSRPLDLASSPIFSQTFLDLMSVNIRNYLPLPQAPDTLNIFVTELLTIDSTMEIAGLEPVQESARKKRKLNSGREEDHELNNLPSAEPIISLLIQFLKGLRITVNQEKHLNKEFRIVYEQFLEKIFVDLVGKSSGVKKSENYQTRRLTPALKLHYALCKISTQYWTNGVSTELMDKVVATFKRPSGWTDATILMLNRIVLQHVHMTLCSADNMDGELLRHCKDLVSFTMESSQLKRLLNDSSLMFESWNGRLESASGNAFLVASWQIQVNDWLDIVCRFGTKQDMELIAQVIARQFSTPSASETTTTSAGLITIQLLNQILLRSANFYEVPNFRPIFAQTILQHLSASIDALSETDLERKLSTTILSFTAGESLKESANKASFSDALKELVAASNQHAGTRAAKTKVKSISRAAEEHGPKILSLLSILHLLPLEYFEKYERNIILTTMAVLEHYIQHYLVADPTGVKCLLLERRISNDIMTWRSDAGVLFNDSSLLRNVIDYPSWNCSTAYGIEDKDGLGQAIIDATCSMIDSAILYYMAQTHDTVQYEVAYKLLDALLELVQEGAAESLRSNIATPDHRISESRIRTIILSRVCQSFVHCLEHLHHQKTKPKTKALLSSVNADMETKHSSLLEKIGRLFETVQSETTERINGAISVLKSSPSKATKHGSKDSWLEAATSCMDHLELYRTIVQYRQLYDGDDTEECFGLVPDMLLLAKALVEVIDNREHVQGHRADFESHNHAHMAAILTGYSCQYMPLSKSWKSADGAERTLTELLELVLAVSRLDLAEKDLSLLKDAYLSLLGQLSGDLFDNVLHWLLEEAHCAKDHSVDELVLVRYLEITFLSAHHTQKRKVRRQISKLLIRLTQVLQTTQSVQVVIGVLNIMAGICSESSFELRSWELGLVLEGVTSLMSPATPLLLVNTSAPAFSPPLTNLDTSKIFTALYHVLISVARFRQEELMTLIPVFTAILQGIFHGFKSLHASLAKQQQGIESLFKSPFMLLSAGTAHPITDGISAPESSPATSVGRGFVIGDPLPVECAENFARLLTALGSKGVSSLGSYNGNTAAPDATSTSSATSTGSFAITTDVSRAFGKHAPYILMEYFTIQCSVVASISQQSLRSALLPGLYALLNLCSDWEREMMMVGLDNTGKTLLKGLYADYLKYHKYTGR